MKISMILPSRGRPQNLDRLYKSVLETASNPEEVELCIRIDKDDPASLQAELWSAANVRQVIDDRRTLSILWNEAAAVATGSILLLCDDELVLRTPGWDATIWTLFEASSDKILLAYGQDGIQNERLATYPFVHRRWVETLGYFCPPYFECDHNDSWLDAVARAIGRRVHLPLLHLEHMHPIAGKAEWDTTHKERQARGLAQNAPKIFASKAGERKADAEKLRAILGTPWEG
jgi:glycosyltransferase involved in cell wall biosynthesis